MSPTDPLLETHPSFIASREWAQLVRKAHGTDGLAMLFDDLLEACELEPWAERMALKELEQLARKRWGEEGEDE